MGLLSMMKGGLNRLGQCTSTDFPGPCVLSPKNLVNNLAQELVISGQEIEDYVFTKNDVAECKVVASGGAWVWFHIEFKDKKHVEFILGGVVDQSGSPTANFLNFVSFMGL